MINIYHTLKNFPNLSRQIVCKGMLFTNYDCPQPEGKEMFYVEQNFILYVVTGRRILHKQEKTWDLHEGVCVFIKKGAHIAERLGNDGWCVMAFFMPDDFLKELIRENRSSLPFNNLTEVGADHVLPLDVNDLSKSFFLSMLPYFAQSPPPPENLVELKFKELVLSLLANKNNANLLSYLVQISNDQNPSIEEIMRKNFNFNLTIEEYAKLACKSVPTFNREFKKIFKESPARWILARKLALASNLLENTSLAITDVCYECGFENQTHFSRVFKDKMQMSPLKFRLKSQSPQTTI
jgi:AraC family transcriptional regulator, exoenzyme S synthesis regulatory protein ExsA